MPVTVHVGIGYDIIHEHPNCDGAALGQTSYQDFLIFTQGPEPRRRRPAQLRLRGDGARGLSESPGHGPQRRPSGTPGDSPFHDRAFSICCRLKAICVKQAPKTDPRYYYRPWKTILVRTVADGGESYYIQGDHRVTVPSLWNAIRQAK